MVFRHAARPNGCPVREPSMRSTRSRHAGRRPGIHAFLTRDPRFAVIIRGYRRTRPQQFRAIRQPEAASAIDV